MKLECTLLAVPDPGKPGYCPGKILVNCGYCLWKLVATLPCVSPARVTPVWNCQWCTHDWYKVSWSLFVKTVCVLSWMGIFREQDIVCCQRRISWNRISLYASCKVQYYRHLKIVPTNAATRFLCGILSFSPEGYQLWNLICSCENLFCKYDVFV